MAGHMDAAGTSVGILDCVVCDLEYVYFNAMLLFGSCNLQILFSLCYMRKYHVILDYANVSILL
jgi:hypothetical protein